MAGTKTLIEGMLDTDARLWDEFVSYVNTYYAVQESMEEKSLQGLRPDAGVQRFCRDANPFVWDGHSSADPSIHDGFEQAFLNHFASHRSTAGEALEFCRSWLAGLGDSFSDALLPAFDDVVDSPQTWENAYQPISDQLDLRAKVNEWSYQESPEEELAQIQADTQAEAQPGPQADGQPEAQRPDPQETPGQDDSTPHAPQDGPVHPGSLRLVVEDDANDAQAGSSADDIQRAKFSDTDDIAALLALDDPMLARSLEVFLMRGMQQGRVIELVTRHDGEVVACAGLTFADLMPTRQNPSGVYGMVSGVAAKPGYEGDIATLVRELQQKALARGVGELTLLDTDQFSADRLMRCGFTLEGSRLLKRI
ncbi:MAG: hypothetical protein ACI4B6_07895 [Atopobiaceae bacterium]